MSTRLESVVIDAAEPDRLARFWSEALHWPIVFEEDDEVAVEAPGATRWGEGGPPVLEFVRVDDPKVTKNRVHFELASESVEQQSAQVERLVELGARRVDIGQGDVPWVVLADPDGNEFCVLTPREEFHGLTIAAVVVDCIDHERLAPFWSAATGWPIITADDDYTILRDPAGKGTRLELVATGEPKTVKNRVHVDVAPFAGDDQSADVERLIAAGGQPADVGQQDVTWVVLADPEGNEMCVLSPR
jgi:predicted enzyme related to lactoylglutathione lyase